MSWIAFALTQSQEPAPGRIPTVFVYCIMCEKHHGLLLPLQAATVVQDGRIRLTGRDGLHNDSRNEIYSRTSQTSPERESRSREARKNLQPRETSSRCQASSPRREGESIATACCCRRGCDLCVANAGSRVPAHNHFSA